MLFDVVLTAEEWTPENGMLTAAMKVNRGNVRERRLRSRLRWVVVVLYEFCWCI